MTNKKNVWLKVSDLIEILKGMPQDAMVVVDNNNVILSIMKSSLNQLMRRQI